MSHFTCLVIGENIETQLEPYYELECSMDRKEIKEDPRAEFIEEMTQDEMEQDFQRIINDKPEYYYKNIEDFAENYHGYLKQDDVWGRWTNPNSKWDWYEIGGRWTGFFKVKKNPKYPNDITVGRPGLMTSNAEEGYVDSIRLCDIDFAGMKIDKLKGLEINWVDIEKKISENDKLVYLIYSLKENDTKEDYIKRNSTFSTYAVIKDGKWYEKGEMGWWGISSDEKDDWQDEFNKLIISLPEDTLLTVVDCHI